MDRWTTTRCICNCTGGSRQISACQSRIPLDPGIPVQPLRAARRLRVEKGATLSRALTRTELLRNFRPSGGRHYFPAPALASTVSLRSTYACIHPSTRVHPSAWPFADSGAPANPVCRIFSIVPVRPASGRSDAIRAHRSVRVPSDTDRLQISTPARDPGVDEQARRIDFEILAVHPKRLAVGALTYARPLASGTDVGLPLSNSIHALLTPPARNLGRIGDRVKLRARAEPQ